MMLAPAAGHHDLLLDARRRETVGRRAVRLQGEDHPFLDLHRVIDGVQAADDGAFVQRKTQAVSELQPEGFHLAGEAEVLGLGPDARHDVGRDPGPNQRDRRVDPLARPLIGVALRRRREADVERTVITGA